MTDSSDRLERTRLAIIEHVHRKERRRHGQPPDPVATRQAHPGATVVQVAGPRADHDTPHDDEGEGWLKHALHAVRTWWRYHPAHMVVDLATPTLSSYARRKPVQFLGASAAAGALFMLARPWKLISITGLLVAVLKSSQVSALVMSALSASQNPKDDPPV